MSAVSAVLLVAGSLLMTLSALGVWRMPDVYGKLHAGGKASSVGLGLLLAGAAIGTGEPAVLARALLIAGLLVITTPTAAHAVAQAAHRRAGQAGDAEPSSDG